MSDRAGSSERAGISERIDRANALSPQERRAADYLRAHLGELALYSDAEFARQAGVSKATVSRLYRRLGFAGAEEVRAHLRALRAAGAPVVAVPPGRADERFAAETANLRAACAVDVVPAARRIASARRVLVAGWRNSYPLALHLREQLAQCRPGVALAPTPGQSVAEELLGLGADDGADDAVVLFGFRRRPAGFAALVDALAESPAALVVVAEPGAAALAAADEALPCPVAAPGPFDSYAAAFCLAARLADAVHLALPDASAAVERTTALHARLAELAL